jgi:alanine racemase
VADDSAARAASIDDRLAAAGLPPLPRRVWLEIDEGALANNLHAVRELAGPGTAVNAVVKADAYGHGLVPVGRVFEVAGADRLCVASLDEALILRGAGIRLPILVMFAIPAVEVARAARERVEVVAAEESTFVETLERWRHERRADAELVVHLEVETGLARAGLGPDAVGRVAARIAQTPGVRLAAIWSHLARADDAPATTAQVRVFESACAALRSAGLDVPPRHLDATGGLFSGHAPVYEGVRVGLALYGLLPDRLPISPAAQHLAEQLRPAMALKCRPLRVELMPAGTPVGYGAEWHAPRDSLIATLPVGYGDGWARALSPRAQALVRGRRVALVGSVAMDAVMADVTEIPGVTIDDEFVLLGTQGDAQIGASELAHIRTTIPYEVVTTMAHRVPRVYHAGSVLLGLRTLGGETRIALGGRSD